MKEQLNESKEILNEIKVQSAVKELVADANKTNKRIFIVLIIVLFMWFATIGAFLYYINTTGYEENDEYTQEISDVDTIENSNIANGDYYGEDKTN